MAETTSISWCDRTWSPWEGCTKVGPGCDHCYASARNARFNAGANWGPGAPRRKTSPDSWRKVLRWNDEAAASGKRISVFPSLCDPFDNEVDPEWRAELFALISCTPCLDWLLLTKRVGNVQTMLDAPGMQKCGLPSNAWLGATVVNQAEADRDIPKLLAVPARVRFVSVEPMLGPVDLRVGFSGYCPEHDFASGFCTDRHHPGVQHLHWVIAGGESGPKARPMHPDWVRSLRDQCAAAGVPFHFKQWGEWIPVDRLSDGTVEPVEEIIGPVEFKDGQRIRTQWISPNGGIVGNTMGKIGKKLAGRLFDGAEHNGFPSRG